MGQGRPARDGGPRPSLIVRIAIAEKMWKKDKAAALATMIVTNAISASIVANNYNVIGKMERR